MGKFCHINDANYTHSDLCYWLWGPRRVLSNLADSDDDHNFVFMLLDGGHNYKLPVSKLQICALHSY